MQCILGKVGGACWEVAMLTLRGRTEWRAMGPFWNRDSQGAAVFIYFRSEATLVVSILELLSSDKTAWMFPTSLSSPKTCFFLWVSLPWYLSLVEMGEKGLCRGLFPLFQVLMIPTCTDVLILAV